jgi:Glycolipid transfer protein (GLTP)
MVLLFYRNGEFTKLSEEVGVVNDGAAISTIQDSDKRVRLTLQWMIKHEMDLKVERENNKHHYVSGSRSLLRLMWFLDFIYHLMHNLTSQADKELSESAQSAYDTALAPHHPWLLRKTIGGAIYFLPSRSHFLQNLDPEATEDVIIKRLLEFLDCMNPVRQYLWKHYEDLHITDLP